MGHKKGTKFVGIPRNPQHPLPDKLAGNLPVKGWVKGKVGKRDGKQRGAREI